jgi:hypothetical protein
VEIARRFPSAFAAQNRKAVRSIGLHSSLPLDIAAAELIPSKNPIRGK